MNVAKNFEEKEEQTKKKALITSLSQLLEFLKEPPKKYSPQFEKRYDYLARKYYDYDRATADLNEILSDVGIQNPNILEYGSGTGNLGIAIKNNHPSWDYQGIDNSIPMFLKAKEKGIPTKRIREKQPIRTVFNKKKLAFNTIISHGGAFFAIQQKDEHKTLRLDSYICSETEFQRRLTDIASVTSSGGILCINIQPEHTSNSTLAFEDGNIYLGEIQTNNSNPRFKTIKKTYTLTSESGEKLLNDSYFLQGYYNRKDMLHNAGFINIKVNSQKTFVYAQKN